MKKNDELTVTCTDLSDLGFGIAHADGMTVFVSDLLPEEEARIKIIKAEKKYAIARVIERLSDSKERVKPACPVASVCGGCSYLHMDPEAQLAWKQKQLRNLFAQVDPDIEIRPIIGMDNPLHYRNKAQFPIQVKDGKLEGGFYRARSNAIVPVRECAIQSDKINEIYQWLLDHLPVVSAAPLRHLLIRHARKTGQVQVVFIGKENIDLDLIARELTEEHPEVVSVIFNQNQLTDNVILGEEYEVLAGKDTLDETCLDLDIKLHFKSFYQVNPVQMEKLYAEALKMADLSKEDRVIELYSGTGTIGLLAAKQAKEVVGVEIVPEAVANAQENARINHIENARFVCMDATQFARDNKSQADVVFVDPPRKGMTSQGIQDIATLHPRKAVYISCNPRTLARDLKEFAQYGYHAEVIQPVDMFPNTTGVETVALLSYKTPDSPVPGKAEPEEEKGKI